MTSEGVTFDESAVANEPSSKLEDTSEKKASSSSNASDGDQNGGSNEQKAQIRNRKLTMPMSKSTRFLNSVLSPNYVSKNDMEDKEGTTDRPQDDSNRGTIQYRLTNMKARGGPSMFNTPSIGEKGEKGNWWCCCFYLFNHNELIANYLHWSFRSSFFTLFISFFVVFFIYVLIFASFLYGYGSNHPECIVSNGDNFEGDGGQRFYDAFTLSWTTFSTVGYGVIFPSTGSQEWAKKCFGIQFIASLEAFVGVLYAGFCGAILYGKVSRIQSVAQVFFSDPIVIRFGAGVSADFVKGSPFASFGDVDDDENDHHPERIPCPVLEFRIVNRQSSVPGGEIIDGSLNCVASIESQQADPTIRQSVNPHRPEVKQLRSSRINLLNKARSEGIIDVSALSGQSSPSTTTNETATTAASILLGQSNVNQAIDEDSSNLVPRRIFSKLEIETDNLPFFKRVWVARHVLDETSPLLTYKARQQVKKNGGFWPEKLNNYTAVRESIRFRQIIVSLKGTSNVNAADVYAQNVYEFVDINIGYQFANVLFRRDDNSLAIDYEVLNDILEQNGGGAEPFVDKFATAEDGSMFDSVQ